jgi:hypothetical protein
LHVKEIRDQRATAPLSLALKVFAILLPFTHLFRVRFLNDLLDSEIDRWRNAGYSRRSKEFFLFSTIGLAFDLVMLISFAMHMEWQSTKEVEQSKKELEQSKATEQELNIRRQELGIPTIPENWSSKNERNEIIWSDFEDPSELPRHTEKVITESKEIDRYALTESPDVEYVLELVYYFKNKDYGIEPWECSLLIKVKTKEDIDFTPKNISLQQADSVLTKWGLSRR